jgi:hypothetical protein
LLYPLYDQQQLFQINCQVPKLRLTEDGSTATVSMTMEEYKGFIVEFKDLKVKFTDDKSETQILSFVTNGG